MFIQFINQFSNRELSWMIWILVGIIVAFFSKGIRNSILNLLASFFRWKLQLIIFTAIVYIVGIVFVLYKLSVWNTILLKDTIIWMLFAGMVLLFRFSNYKSNHDFIIIIKEGIKSTIIIEYVINLYSFSLITELVLTPVLILLALLIAFTNSSLNKIESNKIDGCLNTTVSILGLVIFIYSLLI